MSMTVGRRAVLAGALASAVVAGVVVAVNADAAAAGCRVQYTLGGQWSGGFTANVAVTNLGDATSGWQLTWTYAAGQTVTQAWSATVSQSGSQVTATNVGYNQDLASNATVSFGFNGAWTASNPAPQTFALNGVTCTGAAATGVPTTGPTASTGPTATASPTATAPTSSSVPTSTAPTTPVPAASTPTTPPASVPDPITISGDTGTHDPSVVKTPAGTYIVAQTGDNIALKTSTDRTTFHNAGAAFPSGASWTTPYTAGSTNLWAPDISYHNGKYYMYYAASSFGSNHSAIFLATSTTGASGSWTNNGLVIETATTDNFNAIDPNLFVDDSGNWWLTFGSFWSGIKQIALDPTTGQRSGTSLTAVAGRNGGAIEAPFLFKHGDYYYLWVSFDLCCQGASSTYRTMVGRSASPNGPFTDAAGVAMNSGGGTQILAGHGSIHGPGGEGVFADTDGDVLVYHYYADSGASFLGLNHIGYDAAGWPFVY